MKPAGRTLAQVAMAVCLATMAALVFLNVVLRYAFGGGIAASEELSRLLFVWMVFIGAAVAYPTGDHMAFTSLLLKWRARPRLFKAMTVLIRLLVVLASLLVAWGAWQQVLVGLDSTSVVLGYPVALLPLPALLASLAIAVMATLELVRRTPFKLGHGADID